MSTEIPWWNKNTPETASSEEAQERLDMILSDKLLWFNPYRVADRPLLDCAERGYWLPFPSITQMLVFHFADIRPVAKWDDPSRTYEGISFRIGNSEDECYISTSSLIHPMTHIVNRGPVWTLINGRHLVQSNIKRLENRDYFVSHALKCINGYNNYGKVYNMSLLTGSEAKRATIIRESMFESKIRMLQQVLHYPIHPDFLGNACYDFDYRTPLLTAIENIKRFPANIPPAMH